MHNTDKTKKYYYSLATDGLGRRCPGKENQDLHEAYAKVSAQNKILKQDLAEAKEIISLKDGKIKELEKKYQGVVEKMKGDFLAFEANMGKIEELIADKEQQLRRLKSSNQSLTKFQESSQLLAQALREKDLCINQLSKELERVSKQNKQLLDQIDIYSTELTGLKLAIAEQSITFASLKQINGRLYKQFEQTEFDGQKYRAAIQDLEQENCNLKQEVYCRENEMCLLKQEFEASKVLQQMEIMELKSKQRPQPEEEATTSAGF